MHTVSGTCAGCRKSITVSDTNYKSFSKREPHPRVRSRLIRMHDRISPNCIGSRIDLRGGPFIVNA